MKNYKIFLMIALAIAIALPVVAGERKDSDIRFNDFYGEVKIRPNAEEDDAYEFAELDTIIYEDDRIKTEEDSGAILGLRDMSTFVIKPETTLIIRTEDGNTNKFEMLAGCIWGNIKKMSEGKNLDFEMSQCVAGIKGTILRLHQSKDKNTNKIDVINGLAEVRSKLTGKVFHVPAGSSLTLKADGSSKSTPIKSSEVKQELLQDLEKMDDKLDDNQIKNKLMEQSKNIRETTGRFESEYTVLVGEMNEKVQNKDKDGLIKVANKVENLRIESSRFKGALEELNATISAANKKDTKTQAFVKSAIIARENCLRTIKKIEGLVAKVNSSLVKLQGASLENLTGHKQEENQLKEEKEIDLDLDENIQESIESVSSSIESVFNEAKESIDSVMEGSSYSDFKNAADMCEKYMNDLNRLSSEIAAIPVNSKTSSLISNLRSKYESNYKFIQKAMRNFASVPEISSSMIKTISDIEETVPTYASEVRKYLAEYNSIERSHNGEAQKRFIKTVTSCLAKYDKMGRSYEKANRMYSQVQKSFNSSSYKTSEYNQVEDAFEKIEQAMNDLDNEASELSSCLENLKNQLEDVLNK